MAVGTRRIRVNAWLPDDPYPIADVDDWPDEDPDPPGPRRRGRGGPRTCPATLAMAAQLSDEPVEPTETGISDDPLVATYHLAAIAPLGPADRFRLLAAPGPRGRLAALDEILDDVDAMLKFRLS